MSEQPQELQQQPAQPQPELQPQQPLADQKPKNKPKRFLLIGGAVLLVIILAGAAYLAGTLMNKPASNQNGPGGGQVLSQGGGPGQGKVVSVGKNQVTPAPELPTIQADVRGVFLSRSGETFTIGTGNVGLTVMGNGSGAVTPSVNYDGPTYQVVVTKDTQIYKDTTQLDPGNTGPIQQTVAPGTLDNLNSVTMIAVWGKKTGDRYIADIIVYMQPQMKLNGGSGGTLK